MSEQNDTLKLLQRVQAGECTPEEAMLSLKKQPFTELGYATLDLHRGIRQGVPEVIYGRSKTPEQICGIVQALHAHGATNILVTGMSQTAAELVQAVLPLNYHTLPKLGIVCPAEQEHTGNIVVAAAGTSDLYVAEEAALTAETLGSRVTRIYDVGVAGLHRTLSHLDELMQARVIVAVAGMEGALASVLGGLVDCPVIAVPTSVGYGASFGGVAALLSMLNSCASGVSVVNIDNGYGAGYQAHLINQMKSF